MPCCSIKIEDHFLQFSYFLTILNRLNLKNAIRWSTLYVCTYYCLINYVSIICFLNRARDNLFFNALVSADKGYTPLNLSDNIISDIVEPNIPDSPDTIANIK
jgi:hypothetical protein